MRKLSKRQIYRFCMADVAKGLFNGLIGNYLIYFFQPTVKSGISNLLPQNKLLGYITVMSVITALSKLVDAVTDPLVANLSDKSTNPEGRRMPFLKKAGLPYALSVFLIFMAPFRRLERLLNENFPDVIVAPFLLTAGTDARRLTDVADNILRFAPIDLDSGQFASIHGEDERIRIENVGECVRFYKDYIKQEAEQ